MVSSFLAGCLIALAAIIYLSVGGVVGSLLFGIGLFTIAKFGLNLYTGKLCDLTIKEGKLAEILVGNCLGTMFSGMVYNAFGDKDVSEVKPVIGLEQEYFLVDKDKFLKREDL